MSAYPVKLHTGEKIEEETDLEYTEPGFEWSFQRHYANQSQTRGITGYKWSTNWDKRLSMLDNDRDGTVNVLDSTPDYGQNHKILDYDNDGDLIPNVDDPSPYNPSVPKLCYPNGWVPGWASMSGTSSNYARAFYTDS